MEKNKIQHTIKDLSMTVCLVACATVIGAIFRKMQWQETNTVVVYILSVVITSRYTTGYINGIFASILSVLLFNWFFTSPYYTLKVNNPTYFVTFLIMAATSLITSGLTTKLKVTSEKAKKMEQERFKGNLLRSISHDIRTPLSGIMGSGEMLMQMTKDQEELYSLSKNIYEDANWLHGLVENILSLTRLQDGDRMLEKQPEAVEEIVGAAVATIEKRYPNREINITLPDEFLMVKMNGRLIHQVLINLVDNAIKHSSDNSVIEVNVDLKNDINKDRQEVVTKVKDRGTGIKEEDLPHVFEMFYTKDKDRKDKGNIRGIGIGLSICKSIVEAHGGKIKAENNVDGKGAVFTFTLPYDGEY